MEKENIRKFREIIRKFEREIFFQNNESCCNRATLAQCHTLIEIEKQVTISVSELAHCMSLDKSTVSRNVDNLLKLGLIKREIPSENRRKALVSLTETGQETCNEINSKNDKYIYDNLSVLTSKEQAELLKMFERITDNMALMRKVKSG